MAGLGEKDEPGLDRALADLLGRQSRLADLQIQRLEAEQAQAGRPAPPKTLAGRLKDATALAASMAVVVSALVVIAMAWNASRDHGLVVESFSVPADLATRGLTGQVVARKVLDRLADLLARSESIRAANSYGNDWGDDLKIELPRTGVSIGEARRALTAWLGHETRISGEVYRLGDTLTVTARAGESRIKDVLGSEAGLDDLLKATAEAIFERTQPYRYAIYLKFDGRYPAARGVLDALTRDRDPLERAWAHKGLATLAETPDHDPVTYARESRAALAQVADFTPALENLEYAETALGHDHQARAAALAYLRAGDALRRQVAPAQRDRLTIDVRLRQAEIEGDYGGAVALARRLTRMDVGGAQIDGRVALPLALALDHDAAGARAAAADPRADRADGDLVAGLAALEDGDPQAVSLLTRATAEAGQGRGGPVGAARAVRPWLALALARSGRASQALALIAATPTDCYLCLWARGVIAGGDRRATLAWFARAIDQAPDLPRAFVERGAARLAWGDVAGAGADARRALAVGPRDPDAWKLLGDIWASRGQPRRARAAYQTASRLAPGWAELRRILAAGPAARG